MFDINTVYIAVVIVFFMIFGLSEVSRTKITKMKYDHKERELNIDRARLELERDKHDLEREKFAYQKSKQQFIK